MKTLNLQLCACLLVPLSRFDSSQVVSAGAHVLLQEQYTQAQLRQLAEREDKSKLRLTTTGVNYIFPFMTKCVPKMFSILDSSTGKS